MVNGQASERAPVLTMPVQEHLLAFDGDGIGHQAATGTGATNFNPCPT